MLDKAIQIIPAHEPDAKALEKMVNASYRGKTSRRGWTTEAEWLTGTRVSAQKIRELMRTPGVLILKYIENNHIRGCVELRIEQENMYVGMLTVYPTSQNRGIGKNIMQWAEKEAKKKHCRRILMMVLSERKELIQWYMRLGYRDTGKRKPFDFDDPSFGHPKKPLTFIELEKRI